MLRYLIILGLLLVPAQSITYAAETGSSGPGYGASTTTSKASVNVVDSFKDVASCPPRSIYGRSFSQEKKIALTFDDGPFAFYTDQILDILKYYDVKATFFLLGKRMEKHPEIVKRIFQEGHTLGIHAYDHIHLETESNETLYAQVQKTQQIFKEILNIKPQLMRPPFGLITPDQVTFLFSKGVTTMNWSINSFDSYPHTNDVDDIYSAVASKAYPGAIVLLHDKSAADFADEEYSNTIKALPRIIEFLKAEKYRFYMLPELLNESNVSKGSALK